MTTKIRDQVSTFKLNILSYAAASNQYQPTMNKELLLFFLEEFLDVICEFSSKDRRSFYS